jgi:hypothetical protein
MRNSTFPSCFAAVAISLIANRGMPAHARGVRILRDKVQVAACSETKFHNLNKYKGARWSNVFNDAEVALALRALLKTDLRTLKETLKEVVYPDDSDSYVDQKGVLTLEGGVPQLYTIMEAKLVIEPCGHIYVVLLENGERFLFFTNDQKYLDNLPPAIERWRGKIETTRSENGDKPKLPVVFKSK